MRHKREQPKAAKTGIAKQPCVWVVECGGEPSTFFREFYSSRAYALREMKLMKLGSPFYRIRKYVRSES